MIRLRPHHLLCALTFSGRGYNKAFVTQFHALIAALKKGAPFDWTEGPDKLCEAAMRNPNHHCLDNVSAQRDNKARRDIEALIGAVPLRMDGSKLDILRTAFVRGDSRAACGGCAFHAMCTDIAANGFRNVALDRIEGQEDGNSNV